VVLLPKSLEPNFLQDFNVLLLLKAIMTHLRGRLSSFNRHKTFSIRLMLRLSQPRVPHLGLTRVLTVSIFVI